jgi:hypothetical protein
MRMFSSLVATGSLFLVVAVMPVIGGVIFAAVLFGLFLLGLVGVLTGVDRQVRQHDPSLDASGWQGGPRDLGTRKVG